MKYLFILFFLVGFVISTSENDGEWKDGEAWNYKKLGNVKKI